MINFLYSLAEAGIVVAALLSVGLVLCIGTWLVIMILSYLLAPPDVVFAILGVLAVWVCMAGIIHMEKR